MDGCLLTRLDGNAIFIGGYVLGIPCNTRKGQTSGTYMFYKNRARGSWFLISLGSPHVPSANVGV